jgi:hypothetical protein
MNEYERAAAQMMGSVGDVDVMPRMIRSGVGVGGAMIEPRYIGAPAQAVPQAQFQQSPVPYAPTHYASADVSWFGFGITAVPAGGTATVVLRPKRPFKPQKLFLPSTIIGLLITSADIGGTNMFANDAGIPIELFSEVSTSPQLDWITVEPAVGIEFIIQNPTVGALNFSGSLYGTQVRR